MVRKAETLENTFQLTRLLRGVTLDSVNHTKCVMFQLTRLLRGVTTGNIAVEIRTRQFQLTRLLRGVTVYIRLAVKVFSVSTHTPLARRDLPVRSAY